MFVENSRSVYGLLNWLGDVGGFSSPIYMIFAYFGNWFNTDALTTYIVSQIFRRRDKKKLKFGYSTIFCCKTKQKMMRDTGQERINSQIDIVKFVRNQLLLRQLVKKA